MVSVRKKNAVERQGSIEIHKAGVRNALKPRREPYWGPPLARGQYLGYRKIAAGTGSWIARTRDDDSRQRYRSFGIASPTRDYGAACDEARRWFRDLEAGVSDEAINVAQACREYVDDRRREKGEATARDADRRFARTVYDTELGRRPLSKVRTNHLLAWRDGLPLAKPSANRTLTTLKAALNLAVRRRRVSASAAREWGDVKPFRSAGRRRNLFLDLKQRRALIAAAGEGGLRNFLEASMLTGARAGELVNATRAQFDTRTGSMTFTGKTGPRTVPLGPPALVLFKRLARAKLPGARMLTRDDGKPWAHSDWDELVREAAAVAKLPSGTCLYTLRHSFITQALTDGMATLDVARLVGTSIGMIEKHYGHLVASAARERLAQVRLL
ncbi:MAG: tyrosine-type recombinase/integrase [Pyrinomonadaceae bacterium]